MQFKKDKYRFLVKPRGCLAAQVLVVRVEQDTGYGALRIAGRLKRKPTGRTETYRSGS